MAGDYIQFKPGMDPFSWDIHVDGNRIGALQSHRERPPRVVLSVGDSPLVEVSLDVLQIILDRAPDVTGLVELQRPQHYPLVDLVPDLRSRRRGAPLPRDHPDSPDFWRG